MCRRVNRERERKFGEKENSGNSCCVNLEGGGGAKREI